jgi:hypothetical protein
MRITSLVATALMVCGATLGAWRTETATYVEGNLNGISPNTTGTIQLSDDKTMYLKAPGVTMGILYTSVTKTELGATKVHSHSVRLYQPIGRKTETQLLTIGFRNPDGEDKLMTLELSKSAAKNVAAAIQMRTAKLAPAQKTTVASAKPAKSVKAAAKPAKAPKQEAKAKPEPKKKQEPTTSAKAAVPAKPAADEWWGDQYWKTTRNADKWSKTAGSPSAEQQQ